MVETEVAAIPYERQQDADGNRMCGAAALCMVYRSFGVACAQADVWHAVAGGTRSARTRLICVDCLQRGFDALIVQARVPWDVLRVCSGNSIRAILNHRIAHTSPHGHYTVLVGLDDGRAVVHDPKAGPARNLDRTLLLQLWQPNGPASEITGRVLVAIAHGSTPPWSFARAVGPRFRSPPVAAVAPRRSGFNPRPFSAASPRTAMDGSGKLFFVPSATPIGIRSRRREMSRLILFSARSEPVEPDPKLDALGNELKAMAAAMSKDPARILHGSEFGTGHAAQGTGRGDPVNRKARSSTGSSQSPRTMPKRPRLSPPRWRQRRSKRKPPPRRPNPRRRTAPPDTGGLRLTFWFEKEFTPPEDQTKALTASVVELVQKKKPSVPSSSWKPRQ